MKQRKLLILLKAIFLSLLISSCSSISPTTPDIVLQESAPSTYIVRETYFLSNCDGESELQQVIQKSPVIDVIQTDASITTIQEASIRSALASRYAGQNIALSLVVPQHASMEYGILWTMRKIEIVAKNNNTSTDLIYEVSIPVNGKVSYEVDHGCASPPQDTPPQSNLATETQDFANLKLINSQTVTTDGTALYSADLSIASTKIGVLSVMYPESIPIGSSGTIVLSINVAQELADLPKVIPPGVQESQSNAYALQVSDDLFLYPTFSAALNAVNFSFDSDGYPEKTLFPQSTTEWTWTITPQDVGKQSIVLQISAPIVYNHGQTTILITKVPFAILIREKSISKAEMQKIVASIIGSVLIAIVTKVWIKKARK